MKTIKLLFSSAKTALLSVLCAVVILAAVGIGIAFAAEAGADGSPMDRTAALRYALADAGVTESEITVTKQKLDRKGAKNYYEIEFFTADYAYEYEIDASTGAVTGVSIEALFGKPAAGNTAGAGDDAGTGSQTQPDAGQPGQQGDQSQQGEQGGNAYITSEQAREAALADAGLQASDVTFTKTELDLDDGAAVYDVEFYTVGGETEYEYEINAVTGVIVKKSVEEIPNDRPEDAGQSGGQNQGQQSSQNQGQQNSQNQGQQGSQSAGAQPSTGQITLDTAKAAALADAGVSASEAVFTKAKLDRDDGIAVYEIEFYTTAGEYEYELDAATGAVLDRDIEMFQSTFAGQPAGGTSYIGVDQAKEAAVAHAGCHVADVVFTKAKLERDDGCTEYEIEFCVNCVEWEYTIDAYTGAVLDCESESHHYDGCGHDSGHGHEYGHGCGRNR